MVDSGTGRTVPTLKAAQAEARALGMVLAHDVGLGEYEVRPMGGVPGGARSYFTSDRQDALDTARHMAGQVARAAAMLRDLSQSRTVGQRVTA